MTLHLPTGCPKYAMSFSADTIIDVRDYVPEDGPAVFVIGAMAHGAVSKPKKYLFHFQLNIHLDFYHKNY